MRRLPLFLGILIGVILFGAAMVMPGNRLDSLIGPLGLSGLIPGAEPPLGMNARIALGAGAFVLCSLLGLLLSRGRRTEDDMPTLERRTPDLAPAPGMRMGPAAAVPLAERPTRVAPEPAMAPAETIRPSPKVSGPVQMVETPMLDAPVAPAVAMPVAPAVERSNAPAVRSADADDLARVHQRLDTLEDRMAAQLAQMAQQLAEIASTTRQLARTPASPAAPAAPARLNRAIVGEGASREKLARAARELRASLPALDS